ncbi:hypothetical protein B0H15DRAFT_946981 [Mycena belliarum]|uniref:Uncharacterized protein n=1 Tax=Mycena belliarum TaxID=1033014 RepID=A0AAD6XUV0_9AGAR|nr:hypothetical protein B0H15DRAFT_946981 [Mycena belliae]
MAEDSEDIDSEALQAQIDLSLSFAQNLVSSWVKPMRNPPKSSSRALEAELKEYMRRPPRLGVGAPIPELASSSRETERLKSHLTGKGKKRVRGDEDDADGKQPSDNEEESRGASIKKKSRTDPFESHGKKKKKAANGPLAALPSDHKGKVPEEDASAAGDADVPKAPQLLVPSPKKAKKKKHKHRDDHVPPPTAADSESLPGPSKIQVESSAPTSPVRPSTPNETGVIDISLITDTPPSPTPSTTSPTRRLPSTLPKGPILNLTGPPTDDESDEEATPDTQSVSPKKKRRKRKKKKKNLSGAQQPPS